VRNQKREGGFTLVELIITMTIFVIVIAATAQVFTALISQFKQQSKIAETNTEGIVGLEILRRDLSQAGIGLPWTMNSCGYSEAAHDYTNPWVDTDLNDGPPDNPARAGLAPPGGSDTAGASNAPAPFRSLIGVGISASSGTSIIPNSSADVLVIKSAPIAMNDAAQKSTYIVNLGGLNNTMKRWNTILPQPWNTVNADDLAASDNIIILNPSDGTSSNILQNDGARCWTTLGIPTFSWFSNSAHSGLEPQSYSNGRFTVYGISQVGSYPRMPFNRADFYVKRPTTGMPSRCAPNTGILYKGTINHSDGAHSEMPLLDCVADLKVDFFLDTDGDGSINWSPTVAPYSPTNNLSAMTAAQVRNQVHEVRVYIVAHEGQKDTNYDFSLNNTRTSLNAIEINPATPDPTVTANSRTFATVNLKNLVGNPEYKYYRWKLYTLIVRPNSMR